jgi:hypothetical protein
MQIIDHNPPEPAAIKFVEDPNGHWGTGSGGRRWHIRRAFTGWRLAFRDPGDGAETNAGVHATLEHAMREANR